MLSYVYISLFVSIPESLLILLLGSYLCNMKNLDFFRLLIVSTIQALISLMLLLLEVRTSYATILQILSLCILVLLFFQLEYYKVIILVLIGAFIQGALQSIVLPILSNVLEVEIIILQKDFKNAIICFLPVLLISVLAFLLIKKKNYYICDLND